MIAKIEKNIFLVDAIGAFITAMLVYFVVGGLPDIFGLEPKICKTLGYIAFGFFIYSILNHLFVPKTKYFRIRLAIIVILNLAYCLFTLSYVFGNEELTTIGRFYIIIEILIVLLVVGFETRTIIRAK